VIVTLGAAGAVVAEARVPDSLHVPAFAVSAEDATAAGDAFVGALAVALANGGELAAAARRGAAAGALAAMRRGAQSSLPHAAELERFLEERRTNDEAH
jgi:ribokinase